MAPIIKFQETNRPSKMKKQNCKMKVFLEFKRLKTTQIKIVSKNKMKLLCTKTIAFRLPKRTIKSKNNFQKNLNLSFNSKVTARKTMI
jgi:hypothetical protein